MLSGSRLSRTDADGRDRCYPRESQPRSLRLRRTCRRAGLDCQEALRKDREERYQPSGNYSATCAGVQQELEFEVQAERTATPTKAFVGEEASLKRSAGISATHEQIGGYFDGRNQEAQLPNVGVGPVSPRWANALIAGLAVVVLALAGLAFLQILPAKRKGCALSGCELTAPDQSITARLLMHPSRPTENTSSTS